MAWSQSLAWVSSLLALALAAALWRRASRARARSDVHLLPMPDGASLLWGHEKAVLEASAGEQYMRWFAALGTAVMRVRGAFQSPDILVLGDTRAVAHIFQKRIYDYHHSPVVRPRMARLLGKSLVWVEGEAEHRRMRALFTPALSAAAVKAGMPDFYLVTSKICDALAAACAAHAGSTTTVNISDYVGQATLQIIGRFGFGHDFFDGTAPEGPRILGAWRAMATMGMSPAGIRALMLLRRFSALNHVPLRATAQQGAVRATIHALVAARMVAAAPGAAGRGDMLSRLLVAHAANTVPTHELMDHIVLFIMAGSETTAQSLAYALWELARHPAAQAALRAELAGAPPEPGFDALQAGMPYLDAVLRETIRLHPVVPYMERVATAPDVLPLHAPVRGADGAPLHSVAVRPGQTVVFPVHFLNRAPALWGPDGGSFRPERWLSGELAAAGVREGLPRGWSHTLTFSDGPRSCVGYRLALVQFKVVLAGLVRRFEFSDAGVEMVHRVTSSIQPCPAGMEAQGPCMPLKVRALA